MVAAMGDLSLKNIGDVIPCGSMRLCDAENQGVVLIGPG
jgi:hypothetical protein